MLHWILTICVGIFDEQPLDGKEQTMVNEVNEVINNICNKLGYAATEITPEMAKYMIARDTFICIMATLICAIGVLVAVKMIKKIQKDKAEDPWSNNLLEGFVYGACGLLVIVAVITWWSTYRG